MLNHPYTVSFYIARNLNLQPVSLADFSILTIGGPNGSVLWTSTPTPVNNGQWYQWTGTYTPALSDVGGPFSFNAKWNLNSMHSIALDGTIQVPEPTALLMAIIAIGAGLLARRPRKRHALTHGPSLIKPRPPVAGNARRFKNRGDFCDDAPFREGHRTEGVVLSRLYISTSSTNAYGRNPTPRRSL